MRKMTIVVPVLMTSCHVSLKERTRHGQIAITATATQNVSGRPVARAVH